MSAIFGATPVVITHVTANSCDNVRIKLMDNFCFGLGLFLLFLFTYGDKYSLCVTHHTVSYYILYCYYIVKCLDEVDIKTLACQCHADVNAMPYRF